MWESVVLMPVQTWTALLLFMDYKFQGEGNMGAREREEDVDRDIVIPQDVFKGGCSLENSTGVQRRWSCLKGDQNLLTRKERCINHGDPFT